MLLADEQRRALEVLTGRSGEALARLFAQVDVSGDPAKLAKLLAELLPEVTDPFGSAAASLAADFYEELRIASAATAPMQTTLAAPAAQGQVDAMARWSVGPLFGADPAPGLVLARLTGSLSRLVADQHRKTVEANIDADPEAPSYARHASANACAFCAMLATRGPVYRTAASAGGVTGVSLGGRDYRKLRKLGDTQERFDRIAYGVRVDKETGQVKRRSSRSKRSEGDKYHDHCHCIAVPVWDPSTYEEPAYVEKWREAYDNAPSGGAAVKLSAMREQLGTK